MSQSEKSANAVTDPGQTEVYEISDVGFTDGIEIRQLIQLLEIQNNEGVNDALNLRDVGLVGGSCKCAHQPPGPAR